MDIKKQNLSQFAQDYYGFELKKKNFPKSVTKLISRIPKLRK